MMDLESIVERATVEGAASVTVEDMTSQFPAHRPGASAQIKWLALLD